MTTLFIITTLHFAVLPIPTTQPVDCMWDWQMGRTWAFGCTFWGDIFEGDSFHDMWLWQDDWCRVVPMYGYQFRTFGFNGERVLVRYKDQWQVLRVKDYKPTADFDLDGDVDMIDFGFLQRNLGSPWGDLTGDGLTNNDDVVEFRIQARSPSCVK